MAKKPAIKLPELQAYPKQDLVEERIDPAILDTLRTSYSQGETVTVRVPLVVYPSHTESSRGHVDLHLAQAAAGTSPVSLRLRDDITVPRAEACCARIVSTVLSWPTPGRLPSSSLTPNHRRTTPGLSPEG